MESSKKLTTLPSAITEEIAPGHEAKTAIYCSSDFSKAATGFYQHTHTKTYMQESKKKTIKTAAAKT